MSTRKGTMIAPSPNENLSTGKVSRNDNMNIVQKSTESLTSKTTETQEQRTVEEIKREHIDDELIVMEDN